MIRYAAIRVVARILAPPATSLAGIYSSSVASGACSRYCGSTSEAVDSYPKKSPRLRAFWRACKVSIYFFTRFFRLTGVVNFFSACFSHLVANA
jgi:hypothetical protein